MEHRAPQVRRVWMKKLRMESDGRFRPAHRHGPGRPVPQGSGARAAIEREDRTAISERVPCGLPRTRGNRSHDAVQAWPEHSSHDPHSGGGAGFTRSRDAGRADAHVPHLSRLPYTCSRTAGRGTRKPCAPEPAPRLHAFPRKHAGCAYMFPDSIDDGCDQEGKALTDRR